MTKRMLAWMIYLNDIKYKGGTCWPQQHYTSKPRAGDLYVWPANWTHSHYGVSAPKEIKILKNGDLGRKKDKFFIVNFNFFSRNHNFGLLYFT